MPVTSQRQYRTLDLNDLPRQANELDLLNDASNGGWELIAVNRQ